MHAEQLKTWKIATGALALIACACFLVAFSSSTPEAFRLPKPFYLGGVQINESDLELYVDRLKKIGMNTVEVTHYAKQGAWDSDYIYTLEGKQDVIHEIRLAKSKGIRVVLVLRVSLTETFDRNRFLWHGMILPKDGQALRTWFDRYRKYVVDWAEICEAEGVDVLVIGSELNALTATIPIRKMPPLYAYYTSGRAQTAHESRILRYRSRVKPWHLWVRGGDNYDDVDQYVRDKIKSQQDWGKQVTYAGQKRRLAKMNARRNQISKAWRGIIRDVRGRYSGSVSYAANFDNYMEVDFWDALDFIGINAYFPLRSKNQRCQDIQCFVKTTKRGWQRALREIKTFQRKKDLAAKAVLFTELGYINRRMTTVEPWKGFGFSILGNRLNEEIVFWADQPEDLVEREAAVRSLHAAVLDERFPLQGLLYWKLTSEAANLKSEPFGLCINDPATDPLQDALLEFAEP